MGLLDQLGLPSPVQPIAPKPITNVTAAQGVETTKSGARPIAVKQQPATLTTRLAARDKLLQGAYDKLASARDKLDDEIPRREGPAKAAMQAQKADVDKALSQVQRQLLQVGKDLEAAANPATDAKAMNDIVSRAASPEPIGKAVEIDTHDNPIEKKSPLDKRTTTTTTEVTGGASKTTVHDESRTVGLGGAKKTTTDSDETVTAKGRDFKSTATTTQLGLDGLSREKTTVTENEKDGKKTSTEAKSGMKAGLGGITGSLENKTTAADGSSKATSLNGGVERGDGKAGGTIAGTRTTSNATGGSTTLGGSAKSGLKSLDGGAGLYGDVQGSGEKKHEKAGGEFGERGKRTLSAGAAVGLQPNISCIVTPMADGRYQLTTTIDLGVSIKGTGSGDKEGVGKVGIAVSGSANVYMSRQHILDDTEANAYLAALKTGGSGAQDELAVVRVGLKSWPQAQKMFLALSGKTGSAADVDTMKVGDSKTIGRKTTEGGGINADSGGLGVNVGAEKSQNREMTVSRNKDGSTGYDTRQGQGDKKTAGVTVTAGVASAGLAFGKTVTTATGYRFRVTADMKNARSLQDQIARLADASQADVDAFAKAHPEAVVERSDVRDDSKSTNVTAAVAGVKANFMTGAGIEDTVTRDRDGKIIGTSKRGHNEGGLSVSAGGKTIGTEINEEASGRVGADGDRVVDVKRAQGDTNVVDLLDSLPLVGQKKKDKSALQKVTGAPEEASMTRQVAGITLTVANLKSIAAMAGNAKEWNNALVSWGRDKGDWSAAAAAIRKAGNDPKAIEDALATFVGKDNMRAEVITRLVSPVGDPNAVARWEFPQSIASKQKDYQDLVVAASEKQIAEAAKESVANAKQAGQALTASLDALFVSIKSPSDFNDKSVQQGMLAAVRSRQRAVAIAMRKLDGADDATAEKAQERGDFDAALELCVGFQQTETDLFKQIEDQHKKTLSNADPAEVMRITVEIKNLHVRWQPQYDKLAMLAQENGWAKDRYWRFKPDGARLNEAVQTGKAGTETPKAPETADKRRNPDAVSDKRSGEINREVDSTGWKKYNSIKNDLANALAEARRLVPEIKAAYEKAPRAAAEKLFNQASGVLAEADTVYKRIKPNDQPSMFDDGFVALERYRQGLTLLRKARTVYGK
ncbi:MAG: hypothetical protein ABI460_17440 [Caldimonas sp.]